MFVGLIMLLIWVLKRNEMWWWFVCWIMGWDLSYVCYWFGWLDVVNMGFRKEKNNVGGLYVELWDLRYVCCWFGWSCWYGLWKEKECVGVICWIVWFELCWLSWLDDIVDMGFEKKKKVVVVYLLRWVIEVCWIMC